MYFDTIIRFFAVKCKISFSDKGFLDNCLVLIVSGGMFFSLEEGTAWGGRGIFMRSSIGVPMSLIHSNARHWTGIAGVSSPHRANVA